MSATEQFVDVTYRGLEVGRRLRLSEVAPTTAYLELSTPLPVGAKLAVLTDEGPELEVQVVRVYEQVAGAERPPGMRIRAEGLRGEAERWWNERVTAEDADLPGAQRPAESAPEVPESEAAEAGDGRSTDVMSTEELRAITGDGREGGGNGEPANRSTAKMSPGELKAITDSAAEDGAGESGRDGVKNGRDGRRKRKRRSRKKKKS